jgi:hypothetical protein
MSDEPQPKARETSRVRTIFAVIFGIIAVVGLFASTVAVWANGILFDSDKVASAAEKAIQQPEAAASMSTYVADQLFTIVDLNALLQEQLPDKLDPLSGVIVGGAREFVEGQLAELLQKPGVQAVLVGIVRTGHAQLMNVLDGDGLFDGVSVSDGKVTLNMLPIVALGFAQIQKLGLLTDVTLPDLSAAGDPTQQIGALEATFGRDLPDGFGQLTVFEGDAVAEASQVVQQAQQVVVLVKRAIVVILVVTVVDSQRRSFSPTAVGGPSSCSASPAQRSCSSPAPPSSRRWPAHPTWSSIPVPVRRSPRRSKTWPAA